MNTEKIEKLKKSLSNTKIPADLKPKIEAEIKRLESLDAKQEVKEEAKEEAKEVVAKKPRAKRVATKKATAKPSQTRKPKRTAMSLAKEIRKEGESWNDARARASKMMKEETKTVSKKVESELDKLNRLVKRKKELRGQVGKTNLLIDAKRKAKPMGRRVSKDGNVYYENRANRTDRGTYGKYHLAEGGYLTDPTFGTFQNQVLEGGGFFSSGRPKSALMRDRKNVNHSEDYEVRYSKPRPTRSGYNGNRRFELGGTVVVDLAGHTGAGDGGLNAGMPLDGVSGTNYNGLVGETGAMSSGEMFAKGGAVTDDLGRPFLFIVGETPSDKEGKDLYNKLGYYVNPQKGFKGLITVYAKDKDILYRIVDKKYHNQLDLGTYELGGGLPSGSEQSYMITEALGNPAQHLNKGGSVTNERKHVNHDEDYEVRYAKPRPSRKGYKGVRGFETGGNVDSKKQQLKKGDVVIITGRRWFDKANGNTYHTAMVNVNGQSYGKSPITYGYEEQYMQTGKEILLKYFNLPKGMKETSPLWQLREYGVQLINFVNDGLKRDLEDGGDFQSGVYANGGGVRTINGREYSYGRNWTNDHDHVNKGEEHEVNYRSKKSFFKDGGKVYANGGGVDEPSIYVADLEAYNNGKLVGEWLNLTDYNDADELMDAIRDVLKKSGGEEYAIHDVENIPSSMYSEYMGKSDFKQLYDMIDLSKEQDLPLPVVQDIVSQYDASAVYEFVGKYDSADDFAQQLSDDMGGIQNFNDFERYLIVSETDRRLLAQENADMYVDDVSYEDGGNRIVEEADLDLEEYEEADSERQEEMVNEAKEIVYDRLYNEWYDGLNDPYYFLVEEQGIYDAESFANANFVQVDYEDLGDALEDDYAYIYYNSDLYVFNVR